MAKTKTPSVSLDDLPALIPFTLALRVLGVGRETVKRWIESQALPRPVRPVRSDKSRMYFKRDELLAALKRLS